MHRVAASESISDKIREQWQPPPVGTLHWDGKLMSTLMNKYHTTERLPVLVSGIYPF